LLARPLFSCAAGVDRPGADRERLLDVGDHARLARKIALIRAISSATGTCHVIVGADFEAADLVAPAPSP
jgi:hypothetical protein